MTWWTDFPSLDDRTLRELRRTIDGAFRSFTREWGDTFETLFLPLREFLIASEQFLTQTPWPLLFAGLLGLIWLMTRSWKIVLGSAITLGAIGVFGMWEDTMRTFSMILVATIVAITIGLPIGILMSRSDRLQRVVTPVLDVMQTMPSFVYLIPVVMLLGIGRVPGLIAVVIYAIPPTIRFTNLGVRLVSREVLEAAEAFGASPWQKMRKVQLPLALPTIMGGINQTIMMGLSMVVIAAMIGVPGLGQPVLRAISNQYFTMGILNGLAIVGIAIILDRATQAYGKRLQRHQEMHHG